MAAASVVAASAAQAAIHPPASPFADLLRRSRFASFDPAIRQTYSAPPAHAHRGDWGLKKPIALRRRNAFITLTSYEHPAQFIEWNHAENQVRFVRRVEEMGIMPNTANNTPWQKAVGRGKTELLLDSEFCPGEGHEIAFQRKRSGESTTMSLPGFGNKGPGQYGANRGPPNKDQGFHVSPNINAMSTREFTRYLENLRKLRPAFKEYIKDLAVEDKDFVVRSLYELSQNTAAGYHRRFLKKHTTEEFANKALQKIEQHPHPNAGLIYHNPTSLDTHLLTKSKPGFVLNTHVADRSGFSNKDTKAFVASFGGITASLKPNNVDGKTPLFDPSSTDCINQAGINASTLQLRPRGLTLLTPPKVVGRRAQGLKAVRVQMDVATDGKQHWNSNPHFPGTFEYCSAEPETKKSKPASFTRAPRAQNVVPTSWEAQSQMSARDKKPILATLQSLITQKNVPRKDKEGA